jgi:hypothetical protein
VRAAVQGLVWGGCAVVCPPPPPGTLNFPSTQPVPLPSHPSQPPLPTPPQALVMCLEEFDPSVKESAAWALGYIATHTAELAQAVVDAGAVPLLVLCIQEPEISLKRITASALNDISKHSPEVGGLCRACAWGRAAALPLPLPADRRGVMGVGSGCAGACAVCVVPVRTHARPRSLRAYACCCLLRVVCCAVPRSWRKRWWTPVRWRTSRP